VKYTDKLKLQLPENGEFYNLEVFNANSVLIDKAFNEMDVDANDILNKIKTVDGEGSGLDADMLDGKHSTAFATSDHKHEMSDINNLNLTAENTTVKDTDNNFVSGTVEGALQELATKDMALDKRIDDNKTEIDRLKQSVADGKSKIATSVSGKGVPTNGSDPFQTMADNIDTIKTKLPILEGDVGVAEDTEGNIYGVEKLTKSLIYLESDSACTMLSEILNGNITKFKFVDDGYICLQSNKIVKLDFTGSVVWEYSITDVNYMYVDKNNYIYCTVSYAGGKIIKLDIEGQMIWEFALPQSSSVLVSDDGYVYATRRNNSASSADGKVLKLTTDGVEIWSRQVNHASSVAINDSYIFVSTDYTSGKITKYNFDGDLVWVSDAVYPIQLLTDSDGGVYFRSRNFIAKRNSDGVGIWTYYLDDPQDIKINDEDFVFTISNKTGASSLLKLNPKLKMFSDLIWKYPIDNYPRCIEFDKTGYVFVSMGSRVVKLKDNTELREVAILKEREVE